VEGMLGKANPKNIGRNDDYDSAAKSQFMKINLK
jgi:hypothetical protein